MPDWVRDELGLHGIESERPISPWRQAQRAVDAQRRTHIEEIAFLRSFGWKDDDIAVRLNIHPGNMWRYQAAAS